MIYCVNPVCPKRHNPEDASHCLTCGTSLLVHNRYCLLRRLHDSEVKEVFEVEDVVDNDTKILKIVKAFPNIDFIENHIERIQREARTLIGLNLPSVPRVALDGYFTLIPAQGAPSIHCLAMEKIEGQDLKQWIETHGPISADLALQWLKQLVEVIDQVHQEKLIHRDIEPSNIIRRPDGTLALIDFDTVCSTTEAGLSDTDKTLMMSDCYAAPEQFRDFKQFQNRVYLESDLYSLGRTFVDLLTGKCPCSLEEVHHRLIWRDHVPKRNRQEGNNGLTEFQTKQLFNLIDRFMAYEPKDRPSDKGKILQRIRWIELYGKVHTSIVKASAGAALLLVGVGLGWGMTRWEGNPVSDVADTIHSRNQCEWESFDITDIDFSPSGDHLASTSSDGTLRIRDINQEDQNDICFKYKKHSEGAIAVQFSPGAGRYLATAGLDGVINLFTFDSSSGAVTHHSTLEVSQSAHEGAVSIVAMEYSPNGNSLAAATNDGRVKVWDMEGNILQTKSFESDYVTGLSFSPNSDELAIARLNQRPIIWTPSNGNVLEIPHENAIDIKFSPEEGASRVATIDNNGVINVWDTANTESPLAQIRADFSIASFQFNSNGRLLFMVPSNVQNYQPSYWIWQGGTGLKSIPKSRRSTYISPGNANVGANSNRHTVKLILNKKLWEIDNLAIAKSDGTVRIIYRE